MRGQLVVHGHFYQPFRVDPFTGLVPHEPAAAPYHDWNARINEECYCPNAERGNLDHMSFDVGPTLATWLEAADPSTYARFVAADRPTDSTAAHGNAMAQAFHHTILPLASLADRRTEIRWGIRDFEIRYGRLPEGLWLPETAVDLPTLRVLAEHGIRYTILAPWQAADASLDTRRLYRVELGGGRSIGVAFYDGGLSGAVSFDPSATADADTFIRDRLIPRFGMPAAEQEALRARVGGAEQWDAQMPAEVPAAASATSPMVVIATDGELYGHHQKFRDLFLHRLVAGPDAVHAAIPDRGFDVVRLADAFADPGFAHLPVTRITERTSWSCHHGVARWSAECPDATDGRWKGPLRSALERLAARIDIVSEEFVRGHGRRVDLGAARDAYIEVVSGIETGETFVARWLGTRATAAAVEGFLDVLEAQRWRLAMFQSDGWFWDDPIRFETKQVLRAAARAVRLVEAHAPSHLEARFGDDLTLLTSPSRGLDGFAIYRAALDEVGQPTP